MRTRHVLVCLASLAATQGDVSALTPPSKSDGPIKLLACVVSTDGTLEAEVDNSTDSAQTCNIRCNYDIAGQAFTHWFEVSIPARFNGRVGRFDTSGGKPGNYSGDVGTCQKIPSH